MYKILIVEDDVVIADGLKHTLKMGLSGGGCDGF